jgi:hypothetical protein
MGSGGQYQEPAYLQVRTVFWAAGRPVPQVPEDDMPAIWIEHLTGTVNQWQVGSVPPLATETIGLFSVILFTPEIVGYTGNDENEFAGIAEASADTYMRRIRRALLGWAPGVACPVSGEKATQMRVDRWAYPCTRIGAWKLMYTIALRCMIRTEP